MEADRRTTPERRVEVRRIIEEGFANTAAKPARGPLETDEFNELMLRHCWAPLREILPARQALIAHIKAHYGDNT
jgi:hypothetical protein